MREILFRGLTKAGFVYGSMHKFDGGTFYVDGQRVPKKTIGQYTGYKMFDDKVFFGDLVSNNYKTDKEVVREVILHEGRYMMKRVSGKSKLGKYINLHEWHALNFRICGNIHQTENK